jgi:high-affinity iron transporter
MLYSLLITLREGFEIALIVAIVLGYLAKTGRRETFPLVWSGVAIAATACVLAGATLQVSARRLSGQALEAFEGGAMLFAFVVLTWMLFWMRRQSATLGRHLRSQVDQALRGGSGLALAVLAASAVGREGLETALFLFAGASSAESGTAYIAGGIAGFIVAGALGYLVYRGTSRLPIRSFFSVSGMVVIVLAAGLLSNGMAELHEAGLLANLGPRLWDTDALLPMTSTTGRFLHAIAGYDSAPTLAQVVGYWMYLVTALTLFVTGSRPARRPATGARAPSTA